MLKYNLKDLTKAYENGIVNKAYQGLTKNGYQWVDVDSRESTTLQEQMSCRGLRFSVDDYMNVEGKPVWHIGEICEIDGQRKYGNFRIENDELVLILDRNLDEYCGEDEEGNPIYMELGRWHRGETVELRGDTLTVNWIINDGDMYTIPWQCYIDRKGTGRVVYQRYKAFDYLTFTALEDGTFSFSGTSRDSIHNSVSYSIDGGNTWVDLPNGSSTPVIHAGEKIMWRGTCRPIGTEDDSGAPLTTHLGIGSFSSTGRFNIAGSSLSLIFGSNYATNTDISDMLWLFDALFKGCTKLVDASEYSMVGRNLATRCYRQVFYGCTALSRAPELLAKNLSTNCYLSMFENCTSLVEAPRLIASNLAVGCYANMFRGCTSLKRAPELNVGNLSNYNYCYNHIFDGCTSLNYVKCLATDFSSEGNTREWMKSVPSGGTFYAKASANWTSGDSGIPSGWTRVNV